ncbi:MAG: CRISPR-associated endonuclease Cas1 [Blastocatellia bacterium]|nr:CRISPR-associated endonuclease Cas1 [Blastocatellia bacterium]
MTILYVTEQGATIKHNAGRVVVRREDRILNDLPDFKLEQIVTFGNVNLTPGLMAYCFQAGIDVAFLSSTGKYRGRLQPEFTKNVLLRMKQYEKLANPEFAQANAARIVSGKINSMLAMVRQQRRLQAAERSPIAELEAILPKLPTARSFETLNGLEGSATAAYFRAFKAALKEDWGFQTRQYHPAPDPVNALLSLGYTLLYNNLYAAINIVGLDPYLGTYHRPRQGHAALASDLMEEHRCVLVDRLVLSALNLRTVQARDFVKTPDGQMRLVPDALKRFLALYAQQLQAEVVYPAPAHHTNWRTNWRQVLELQVRQFARVVQGEETGYQPFRVDSSQ